MSDERIRDPRIAEQMAYHERRQRFQAQYWFGWVIGQAAMGREPYTRMLALARKCAEDASISEYAASVPQPPQEPK